MCRLYICVYVCFCLYLSIFRFLQNPQVYLPFDLSLYLVSYQSLNPSIIQSIPLSVYVYLSGYVSIYMDSYLSLSLSVYPSISLYTHTHTHAYTNSGYNGQDSCILAHDSILRTLQHMKNCNHLPAHNMHVEFKLFSVNQHYTLWQVKWLCSFPAGFVEFVIAEALSKVCSLCVT